MRVKWVASYWRELARLVSLTCNERASVVSMNELISWEEVVDYKIVL